jgi:hypothetical protein
MWPSGDLELASKHDPVCFGYSSYLTPLDYADSSGKGPVPVELVVLLVRTE